MSSKRGLEAAPSRPMGERLAARVFTSTVSPNHSHACIPHRQSYPGRHSCHGYVFILHVFASLSLIFVINMSDTRDNSEGEVSVLMPSKRKHPEKWKRNVRKGKRDGGEQYVSEGGALVAARKIGPECSCKNACFDKVGKDNVESIFNAYWALLLSYL